MWFLKNFFHSPVVVNERVSLTDGIKAGLRESDVAGLLKLRDNADQFIHAVNEELVTRDRGRR